MTPRSRRTEVRLVEGQVRIRVAEAPENGRATEAARRALAKSMGLPRRAVTLRSGITSRTKRFRIEGLSHDGALQLIAEKESTSEQK